LTSADLSALGDTPITILQTAFPNRYLRMDGTGVTTSTNAGGGIVNCQYGTDRLTSFKVRAQTDGSYSFESVAFPNVYLRMDGSGVVAQSGGGTVNCQYSPPPAGPYERFIAHAQTDGSFSFESAAFPNVYLGMNGSGVSGYTASGGGVVYCSPNANGGTYMKFVLNMVDQNVNFVMQHQEQTLWCWDAATVSVALFYQPASGWTQCGLANNVFARNDCCVGAGQTSPCNQGNWPDVPLQRVGHLNVRQNVALTSAQLGGELAQTRPVVCNISWAGGGGHIVALRGRSQSNGVEHVAVSDPWYGDSDAVYTTFRDSYQGSGTWNVSYKTQP
jgi:hypothetical protein